MEAESRTESTARDRAGAAYDALADRVEVRVQGALNHLSPSVKPKLRGWLHLEWSLGSIYGFHSHTRRLLLLSVRC